MPQFSESFRNQNKSRVEHVLFNAFSYVKKQSFFEKYLFLLPVKLPSIVCMHGFLKLAVFCLLCIAPQTRIDTQIHRQLYLFFSRFVALEFKESRKAVSTPFRNQSPVLFKLWVTNSLYFGCLVKSSKVTADSTSCQCLAIKY